MRLYYYYGLWFGLALVIQWKGSVSDPDNNVEVTLMLPFVEIGVEW